MQTTYLPPLASPRLALGGVSSPAGWGGAGWGAAPTGQSHTTALARYTFAISVNLDPIPFDINPLISVLLSGGGVDPSLFRDLLQGRAGEAGLVGHMRRDALPSARTQIVLQFIPSIMTRGAE